MPNVHTCSSGSVQMHKRPQQLICVSIHNLPPCLRMIRSRNISPIKTTCQRIEEEKSVWPLVVGPHPRLGRVKRWAPLPGGAAGRLSQLRPCALVSEVCSFPSCLPAASCPGKLTHVDHITGSCALWLPFQFGQWGPPTGDRWGEGSGSLPARWPGAGSSSLDCKSWLLLSVLST